MGVRVVVGICVVLAFSAFAETEEHGGIVWSYMACEGGVAIDSGKSQKPAIPPETSGKIAIPMQLGGQPVVQIGNYAFYGCTAVTDVAMSNDVREVCDSAFRSCSNLVSVVLSSNLVTIGRYAFQSCTGLREIEIPNDVTNIGHSAFRYCRALTSAALSDGLQTLGNSAFSGCSNIVTVAMPPRFTAKNAFPNAYERITSVTLSDGVTEICASAFGGCKALSTVNLPSNLTSIGAKAFKNCSGLTSVTLPGTVTEIGTEAFMNCTSVQSVEIPNSVVSVGENAFAGCKAIVSVAVAPRFKLKSLFPDSYAKISSVTMLPGFDTVCEDAFKGCKEIVSMTISEGVISIGDDAFSGCTDLQEVILPNSLVEIGKRVFNGCRKIVTVSLPARFCVGDVFSSSRQQLKSVTILPDSGDMPARAFYKCSELSSIFFQSPTPPKLSEDALLGVLESVRIVVPTGSVAAYVAAEGWKVYVRQIEAEGEYPIVYSLHGGANAAGNPLSYRTDQLPFALGGPTKAGGVFDGWYMEGARVTEIPVGTTGCVALSASWRIAEPIAPPTADYFTYKAQYDGIVWDVAKNRLIGVLCLKSTKMNDKTRAVKISGYLLGLDGKKKSVKQNAKKLFVSEAGPLTADFTVEDIGQMTLVIGGETVSGTLEGYQVRTFAVGGDWTREDAVATSNIFVLDDIPGEVQMRLLPVGEPVMPKKGKWAFNKAAMVSWKKPKGESVKGLVIDTSKNKTNLSGLKLTYTPKTGAFKGSFKIHALEDKVSSNEKTKVLKKYTVKVTGVVVDGIGYGKAVLRKTANEWTLSVD